MELDWDAFDEVWDGLGGLVGKISCFDGVGGLFANSSKWIVELFSKSSCSTCNFSLIILNVGYPDLLKLRVAEIVSEETLSAIEWF